MWGDWSPHKKNKKLEFVAEVVGQEHGESMEVAVGVDVADFGDECFGIDEFAEGHEAMIELSDRRDHMAIEIFFDEGDVCPDAEA